MMRNLLFLLSAFLLPASTGCTDRGAQDPPIGAVKEGEPVNQDRLGNANAAVRVEKIQKTRAAMPQNEQSYAPDIEEGWQWSAHQVSALTKRAEAGDIEAADRLHQYYSVHENLAKIHYWDEWLFERGDSGAISRKVSRLYSRSKRRKSGDPQKLVELIKAERLEDSVTVDGEENLFLDKIRSEIAFIERTQ